MPFTDSFTNYDFPFNGYLRLPEPPLEEIREARSWQDLSNHDILTKLCRENYRKFQDEGKIPNKESEEQLQPYVDRIKLELETFNELHFTDYILLIYLIMEQARAHGVFIDPGRGSAPGSIVFWLLGVTGLDPIKNKLFFERFVSKSRAKSKIDEKGNIWLKSDLVPDADLNLGEGREIVLDWLDKKLPKRLCKILTVGTLTEKILVKDLYKISSEATEEEAQAVADMIGKQHGVIQSLEETYEESDKFRDWADNNADIYKIAKRMSGLIRQKGSHASGYLTCYDDLDQLMPVQLDRDKKLVSCYTMDFVHAIKVDLLGLTTNTIVQNVLDKAGEKWEELNLDNDPFIYNKFQKGELLPYGLYQIGAHTAYRVLNDIKPTNIQELSDVNAIARPGALAWLDDYVHFKAPEPDELFKDVVGWSRNLILYQEQLMHMLVKVGFTNDEAELARRAIGKKKVEEIKTWEDKIRNKIKENGFPDQLFENLWKVMSDSAGYQFNLSHSYTVSYMAALTVYLKYKYPKFWYLECLKDISRVSYGDEDKSTKKIKPYEKIAAIVNEMHEFGIKLLPPDLLKSHEDFTVEGDNIRYGLSAIKGISSKIIKNTIKFRGDYSCKINLFTSAKQAGIDIGVLSALIQAGAVSSLGESRSRLVLEMQVWNLLTEKEQTNAKEIYDAGDDKDILSIVKGMAESIMDEKGNPLIKPSRFNTIKKKYEPYKQIYLMNSKSQSLADYFYEMKLLGFSFSQSLAGIYKAKSPDLLTIHEVINTAQDHVLFAGTVASVQKRTSKNDNQYIKLTIQDETGFIDGFIFDSDRENKIATCERDNGRLPEKEDIVVAKAFRKDKTAVYINKIGIQSTKIYLKLRDLNKDLKSEENE